MPRSSARPPRGVSLVEVLISAMLSTWLLLMLSSWWFNWGRMLRDNVADIDLAGEARLALETLGRDFGGCLPGTTSGPKALGRCVGQMVIGGDCVRLCYDGAPTNGEADWASPDTVIEYNLHDGQLLRSNLQTGTVLVAATGVTRFAVTHTGAGLRIEFTLQRRQLQRAYTLVTPAA